MDKIFSGIMGLIIGDAFGVPYEFQHRGTFEVSDEIVGGGTHGQPVGTWSDDTSMVLASMSAYINSVNNKTDLYGDFSCVAIEVSSEDWNQPLCWSEPSKYISTGVPMSSSFLASTTAL